MSKIIVWIEGFAGIIVGMGLLFVPTKVHDAIPLGITLIPLGISFVLVAARDAMDEG